MTAFARQETSAPWGSAIWEVRSVNFRYLDISTKLPEDLRSLEPAIREHVNQQLTRGKIDCTLKFQVDTRAQHDLRLNLDLVDQIAKASQQIGTRIGGQGTLHALDILRWPGVIEAGNPDLDAVSEQVLSLLDEALSSLVRMRAREGEKIHAMIAERCDEIVSIAREVRERMPAIQSALRERLSQRLSELREQLDQERIEQEMVMLASKMDVSEELDRLEAHCSEVQRLIGDKKPVGRRLDFLMQELNREANTLGSKSVDALTTRVSVDLKVLVEQMREQIQNVE